MFFEKRLALSCSGKLLPQFVHVGHILRGKVIPDKPRGTKRDTEVLTTQGHKRTQNLFHKPSATFGAASLPQKATLASPSMFDQSAIGECDLIGCRCLPTMVRSFPNLFIFKADKLCVTFSALQTCDMSDFFF